ncbi:MAG: hypothetical protein ACRD4P_08875 [Bryobacteraceae bacterium]
MCSVTAHRQVNPPATQEYGSLSSGWRLLPMRFDVVYPYVLQGLSPRWKIFGFVLQIFPRAKIALPHGIPVNLTAMRGSRQRHGDWIAFPLRFCVAYLLVDGQLSPQSTKVWVRSAVFVLRRSGQFELGKAGHIAAVGEVFVVRFDIVHPYVKQRLRPQLMPFGFVSRILLRTQIVLPPDVSVNLVATREHRQRNSGSQAFPLWRDVVHPYVDKRLSLQLARVWVRFADFAASETMLPGGVPLNLAVTRKNRLRRSGQRPFRSCLDAPHLHVCGPVARHLVRFGFVSLFLSRRGRGRDR